MKHRASLSSIVVPTFTVLALAASACGSSAVSSESTIPAPSADVRRVDDGPRTAQSTPGSGDCRLEAVYYAFDSSTLDEGARRTLADNARCLEAKRASSVTVVGMADARGTEEYNLALGDRRARSTSEYLRSVVRGNAQIGTTSVGEEYSNGTDESSWARDRRAELRTE
jgi:peptidoglycan-associated lipoprotein